jgi:hypothetical protein
MSLCNFFGAVFFLAINPSPHFVKLKTAAGQVTKNLILVIRADFANLNQQPHNGFLRNAGHSDGGPDRATFDQAVNHLYSYVAL